MKRRVRCCASESLEPRAMLSAVTEHLPTLSAELASDADNVGAVVDASALAPTFPSGVTVTGTEIRTSNDIIPRFAAEPTVTSISDGNWGGNWSDPGVWSTGRVPTDDDRVLIAPGTTVVYTTLSDARLDAIEVGGYLMFSPFVSTHLVVGTMTVMPAGTLQIGTPILPIRPNVTAELVIADRPLDLQNDPRQFGTGLIALGTVTIHGSELVRTWPRLAAEPITGDTVLIVSNEDDNWQPGDTLVLPDTRQVAWSQERQFTSGQLPPQWEKVTIDRIDGDSVFLTQPLQFDHLGARNADDQVMLLPHVANLDRNVIVRSENPSGTRGHVLFAARAKIDIAYARFQDLGRTDAFRDLDNTTFDLAGNVTHIGTNQIARYAVHFHHVMGPVNLTNTGYQYRFVGNTVDGARKWAVAVHGTSYGLVEKNVVYDADGAGFVTEDGSEINNLFRENIAIRIVGTMVDGKSGTEEGDYARGGSGFWFRRSGNQIVGNVAADSTYAGFVFDGYFNTGTVTLPLFRGAARHEPGQGYTAQFNPPNWFANNEAYGLSTYGLWASYISGDNLAPDHPVAPMINLRLWNIFLAGVRMYHTNGVFFVGLTIYGDRAAQDRNDAPTYGMHLSTYENRNLVIRNSHIEGMRIGIAAPRSDASTVGRPRPTVIQNTSLENYINIVVSPAWDYGAGNGTALEVRNVKFDLLPELPDGPADPNTIDPPANIHMKLATLDADLTEPSTVKVYDYNQVPGDDFQVFYREQNWDYVMPQTDPMLLSGRKHGTIGSPEEGFTNVYNWFKHGVAVARSFVTSTSAVSPPEINVLVGPLADTSATTPRVVLVTPWEGAIIPGGPPLRIRYNVIGEFPANSPPWFEVWFALDDGIPFAEQNDDVIFNITPGWHTLSARIQNPWDPASVLSEDTVTFFVPATFGDVFDQTTPATTVDAPTNDVQQHDAIATAVAMFGDALVPTGGESSALQAVTPRDATSTAGAGILVEATDHWEHQPTEIDVEASFGEPEDVGLGEALLRELAADVLAAKLPS